ncbi:MAG: helix-hairpin-helix domain-containing protein [Desulfobacterota bacterium]|nr:helix-hairpin-helix domain-containing protein [Thermodesulfobacteriota bacterium]MDW8001613.1 helix-hairpin-helix domain-containing protein [Deltaproteobacteria bacterium]
MRTRKLILAFFLTSLLFHIFGYSVLALRLEPFIHVFYLIIWWSFIIGLDSIIALTRGRSLLISKGIFTTIAISSAYWSIFELINVRIQNWFYINLPSEIALRYFGYFFAFGTVIPAIVTVREALRFFVFRGMRLKKKVFIKNYPALSISLGSFTFLLMLFYPDYLFPFVWVAPLLVIDGINYKRGHESFANKIENGSYEEVLSTALSGLTCGLLWEFWNYFALAKWVYSVPFFEEMKLFEMPILGYFGFVFFALETSAFLNFLNGEGLSKKRLTTFAALLVCIFIFPLIDRHTVFSFRPKLEELYFIEKEKIEYFKSLGIKSSYGLKAQLLSPFEQEKLKLLHLYGLGLPNLKKLEKAGVNSVEELAKLEERELSQIIGEKNLRRVRLYLKEAEKLTKRSKGPQRS